MIGRWLGLRRGRSPVTDCHTIGPQPAVHDIRTALLRPSCGPPPRRALISCISCRAFCESAIVLRMSSTVSVRTRAAASCCSEIRSTASSRLIEILEVIEDTEVLRSCAMTPARTLPENQELRAGNIL